MELPKEYDDLRREVIETAFAKPVPANGGMVIDAVRDAVERCYALHSKPKKELTDAEICKVADSMPQGFDGFWQTWGYRQFARALLDAHEAKQREPETVTFRAASCSLDAEVAMFVKLPNQDWEWIEPPQTFEVKV